VCAISAISAISPFRWRQPARLLSPRVGPAVEMCELSELSLGRELGRAIGDLVVQKICAISAVRGVREHACYPYKGLPEEIVTRMDGVRSGYPAKTADPSNALLRSFARDDKGRSHSLKKKCEKCEKSAKSPFLPASLLLFPRSRRALLQNLPGRTLSYAWNHFYR
jgi:hypothetical protein